MTSDYDLVLGAGGVKGWGHVGVLRAITRLGIKVKTVTGVSVGAGIAALYTNGKSPDEIEDLFKSRHGAQYNPMLLMRSMILPTAMQWMVSASCVSLEAPWQDMAKGMGLVPNNRLQILSFDQGAAEPVLFQGTNYNLGTAIAASGSAPQVFAPVLHEGRLLVDGAVYHYNPTEFSQAPAIVVRLKRATRWPSEPLSPLDYYYHWHEMYLPLIASRMDIDTSKHVVIDLETPDVAGLSFGISVQRCLKMVAEGEATATAVLQRAIAEGRLSVGNAAQ